MTTPSWPSALPSFVERGSWSLTPTEQQIRTDFSTGPARMRRRSTVGVPQFDITMVFEGLEFEIFKAFFSGDLQNGVAWFDLALYAGGSDFPTHRCRFREPYQARDAGFNRVSVTMKLEARQLLGLSQESSVIIGIYSPEFIVDTWQPSLYQAVHVEWPKIDDTSLVF